MALALDLRVICHHYIQPQLRYNFLPLLRVNSYLDYKKTLATFLYIFQVVFQIVCPRFPYHSHELLTQPDLRSTFRYNPHRRTFWRLSTPNQFPSKESQFCCKNRFPITILEAGFCGRRSVLFFLFIARTVMCPVWPFFYPRILSDKEKMGSLEQGEAFVQRRPLTLLLQIAVTVSETQRTVK